MSRIALPDIIPRIKSHGQNSPEEWPQTGIPNNCKMSPFISNQYHIIRNAFFTNADWQTYSLSRIPPNYGKMPPFISIIIGQCLSTGCPRIGFPRLSKKAFILNQYSILLILLPLLRLWLADIIPGQNSRPTQNSPEQDHPHPRIMAQCLHSNQYIISYTLLGSSKTRPGRMPARTVILGVRP